MTAASRECAAAVVARDRTRRRGEQRPPCSRVRLGPSARHTSWRTCRRLELVVSELATNAMVHACTPFTVVLGAFERHRPPGGPGRVARGPDPGGRPCVGHERARDGDRAGVEPRLGRHRPGVGREVGVGRVRHPCGASVRVTLTEMRGPVVRWSPATRLTEPTAPQAAPVHRCVRLRRGERQPQHGRPVDPGRSIRWNSDSPSRMPSLGCRRRPMRASRCCDAGSCPARRPAADGSASRPRPW